MNFDSQSQNFSTTDNTVEQSIHKQYLPLNCLYPDLYLLMEFDLKSPPPPPPSNRLLYLVCAFATLTFALLGLSNQFSQVQQASKDITNKVTNDYSALINY